ncbi:MAG: hypothetical protein KGH66_03940 [Candidatus Micrarchaeota archaeon]|nr:hypothetical protein [Candidatus Micrarchaeota archaeon]
MADEIQLIKKMETNIDFVISDFKNLQKRYPNEYIAVFGGKVIGDDKNLAALNGEINEKIKSISKRLLVLIKYIPEERVDIII